MENNACKISTNNITVIFSNTTPVTFIYNPKTNSIYTFHGHYIIVFCDMGGIIVYKFLNFSLYIELNTKITQNIYVTFYITYSIILTGPLVLVQYNLILQLSQVSTLDYSKLQLQTDPIIFELDVE